jgi:hypothetical protein
MEVPSFCGISGFWDFGLPTFRRVDHSGRAVCLRTLKQWDRVFESHLRHGYLCAFIVCLCCSVSTYVVVLRRADPPSTESFRLC